jgi:hypothetical protein
LNNVSGLYISNENYDDTTNHKIEKLLNEHDDLESLHANKQREIYKKYIKSDHAEQKLHYSLILFEMDYYHKFDQEKLNLKIAEYKYRKGIEIIKLIYEKILALDHHFTSLNTFQQINSLSNPNSYPEFVKIKEKLKEHSKRKSSIDLPELLENNSLVSLSYSVVSSLFGNGNRKERQEELESISCLLDFTVSMHSDLKIIFYETDYLKLNNLELKEACSQLFKEYTKVASYYVPLEQFRGSDDWDNLNRSLEALIKDLNQKLDLSDPVQLKEAQRKLNNLEFNVNRLLKFIDAYEEFINRGEKYYQKFLTILKNYKYRDTCINQLPDQYQDLEIEIANSISKFKSAYRIAELQGTKLRDLLYGVPH